MLTVDRYARIRQLHRDGLSVRQIARQLGHSHQTVLKALRHPQPPGYTLSAPRPAPTFDPIRPLVDAIPGARLVLVPGRDHLNTTGDKRYKEAVVAFLSSP